MSSTQVSTRVNRSRSLAYAISRHWFWLFTIFFGLMNGLPFLAPILMQIGLPNPAKGIYFIYSFLCHQLPQRSLFLFGPNTMYSLNEIQSGWQDTLNLLVLRQFIGNPELGWKVAWSDRMVSMYTSVLAFSLLWWPFRFSIKPLRWWWLILFLLPMGIDGTTHMISDLWGLGDGFRYMNTWLAELTNYAFPASFYAGDALGSFNSWMRLLTGVLFGAGIVWFAFPYLRDHFDEQVREAEMQVLRTSDSWNLE